MRLDNPLLVRLGVRERGAASRRANAIFRALLDGHEPERRSRSTRSPRRSRGACSTSAAASASSPSGSRRSSAPRSCAIDKSRADGRARRARAASTRRSATSQELPFADGAFDCVFAGWVLYHVPDLDRGDRGAARACCGRAGGSSRSTILRRQHATSCGTLIGGSAARSAAASARDERRGAAAARTSRASSGGTSTATLDFPDRESMRAFVASTIDRAHLAPRVPEIDGAVPRDRAPRRLRRGEAA